MYTLFYSPGASSMAPHIVLEELGVPYRAERIPLDLQSTADGITSPEFLAVNPKGRVPALKIEDRVLTEAMAILVYLARRHPEARLLPADPEAEARCFEWMSWLATTIHAIAFGQVLRPQRFVLDPKDHPAVVAKGRQNVRAGFAYVEQQLAGRSWAVGEQYTVADAYLLFYFLAAKRSGLPMHETYRAWARIAERTMARPAVKRVLEREGLPG